MYKKITFLKRTVKSSNLRSMLGQFDFQKYFGFGIKFYKQRKSSKSSSRDS